MKKGQRIVNGVCALVEACSRILHMSVYVCQNADEVIPAFLSRL